MKALEYKDKDGNWIPLGVINVNDIQCESDVFLLPEEVFLKICDGEYCGSITLEKYTEIKNAILSKKRIVAYGTIENGGVIYTEPINIFLQSYGDVNKNEYTNLYFDFYSEQGYWGVKFLGMDGNWQKLPVGPMSLLSSSPIARTSTPTINAGTQYYNEKDDLTVSNFEGFSSRNKTATILSSKPIKFEGENVLTPVEIPESDYLLYTISYMQTSDIKYVLVVGVEAMKAPQGGLKGEDIEISAK